MLSNINTTCRSPSWKHPRYRDKQPSTLTFTPTVDLVSPINLHVFGLWEEVEVPGGNTHRHGDNMQRSDPCRVSNPGPSRCEAAVPALRHPAALQHFQNDFVSCYHSFPQTLKNLTGLKFILSIIMMICGILFNLNFNTLQHLTKNVISSITVYYF